MAHQEHNRIVHKNTILYFFENEEDPRIKEYINRINTSGLNSLEKQITIYPILKK